MEIAMVKPVTVGQKRPTRLTSSSDRQPMVCVPKTLYTLRIKRVFDIVTASVLSILLLSWLIPVLFVLIRLSSRGPLFFVQQRIGKNGRVFPCMKFRTMRVNDSSHTAQAHSDDDRITPLGRILRITHIDELPQLINVLLNHMSIIGPRPHMLYHDFLFSDMLPQYQLRHLVKPGITGLAQSTGFYGATPDFFSVSGRTRLDVFYVKHVSSRLDLKIFFATLVMVPAKCFKRNRAYDR
jgi:lipopolysaccharide/colanic/teichoic acid biosynthesis glycosyltransferase